MKRYLRISASVAALCWAPPGLANFAFTPSGGTTMFSIDAANQGTSLCAAASTECAASVPVNTAGAPLFTAALPAQVSIANTGSNATPISANISQMGGTSIANGCTAALSGLVSNTVPGLVCGTFGAWVLNNGVTVQATPSGGSSTTGNIAANNTTAVVVKASAGTLYGAQLYGIGSAPAYLKLYDATSATCGSGTPRKRLMIPAAATAANGAGSNVISFPGVSFVTGITYCVTTGITDADTTAPAASTFLVNLDWQ